MVRYVDKKLKLSHYAPLRLLGKRRYSSYSFLTSALDGGEWSASRPGLALVQGKGPPVPIVQEAGWVPEPIWTQRLEEKSSAPTGDRTPIARRRIDKQWKKQEKEEERKKVVYKCKADRPTLICVVNILAADLDRKCINSLTKRHVFFLSAKYLCYAVTCL